MTLTNFLFIYFSSPICFDLIDIAHVTKCGHSFCQNCIQTALEHTHRCPQCNTPCSINKDVFPNFTCNIKFFFHIFKYILLDFLILILVLMCFFFVKVNQIVEKFKEDSNSKKFKASQTVK